MEYNPIRILQVIGIMNRGGAETMIMNLYRNIDRNKVQFDFVQHTNEDAVFNDEIKKLGGRIYHCPKYKGKNHFEYKKWWKDFFDEHAKEYSAVHGHIGSTAAIYLNIANKYNLFTIAHSHSTNGVLGISSIMYRIMSYNTRNIADYFFGCSKQSGIDRFGTKVASNEKIYSILNNAVDTRIFDYNEETRTQIRQQLNFSSDNLVIGHIGRFGPEKNHDFLVEIFAKIHKINKNARLLLVGDGILKDDIMRKVESLDLIGCVLFTGVRNDVQDLIQAMDVFLFPSLFEGLPVTLVEAQTSGLKCVISDNIPKDCILIDEIVQTIPLNISAEKWAETIVSDSKYNRFGRRKEIINSGFDIINTSKWLEDFYLEKCKK